MLLRLLTLPITGPVAGIRYCLEKVAEVAEREMWDETPVREQLMLLNGAYEEGRLGEAEFREREAELLARLRAIRERRRASALASPPDAGGAVDAERRVVIELPEELR